MKKKKNKSLKPSIATRARRYLDMSGDEYLFELAANSEIRLDELSQRRSLLISAALISFVANICVWIFALVFPHVTSNVYGFITANNIPRYGNLLSVVALVIPFAPPFVCSFALLNLRNADNEQPTSASDVMASFQYGQTANRRRLTVVAAGICGALNCFCLLVALLIRTGN